MSVVKAFFQALSAVLRAPRLVVLLWLTLLLAAVPFGVAMQQAISQDIGSSRVHQDLRERMDMIWLGEFRERSTPWGRTLEPGTTSRADFLSNLDLLVSGALFGQPAGLVAAGLGYALVWLLLLGGVIDRFARGGGRLVLSQFLAASGRYFPRLAILTGLSAVGYWAIYKLAHWTFSTIVESTGDVTAETTMLKYYALAAVPILFLTAIVMMVADYARIAAVVEERGAWAALGRGARFVAQRPLRVFALAGLVTLCGLALIALRTVATPGVSESSTLGILGVFLVGQLFVVSRLVLRVSRVGAELTLYRQFRR